MSYESRALVTIEGVIGSDVEQISKGDKKFWVFTIGVPRRRVTKKPDNTDFGTDWFEVKCYNPKFVEFLQSCVDEDGVCAEPKKDPSTDQVFWRGTAKKRVMVKGYLTTSLYIPKKKEQLANPTNPNARENWRKSLEVVVEDFAVSLPLPDEDRPAFGRPMPSGSFFAG